MTAAVAAKESLLIFISINLLGVAHAALIKKIVLRQYESKTHAKQP